MPSDKKEALQPTRLEFDDNYLLQELCGRHDANLILIEERLGVQLVSRGNQLAIFGAAEQVQKAKTSLEDLYQLLKSGVPVAAPQVDAALRVSDGLINTRVKSADFVSQEKMISTPRVKIMPRTVQQQKYVQSLRSHEMSFGVGPAGTGKTYLATAVAINMLMSKQISKLVLTRPVVEAGENLGFLPGSLEEKIDPYLRPLFDAMEEMLGKEKLEQLIEQGVIELAPLAYMRGRTLKNAVILLDEAQNTTTTQMKMFLTRLGEGSRMIITGDMSQIDLKRNVKSGLKDALEVLDGLPNIAVTRFNEADVMRHDLVSRIVQAYDHRDRQISLKLEDE